MHRYAKQEEIARLGDDELLCGALNSYLSLPSFPCSLFFERKSNCFLQVARWEKKHYDKVYQPVYKCTIYDLAHSKITLSSKSFSETCQLVDLVSFFQSTIYFSYIFVSILNQYMPQTFKSWQEVIAFFRNLKQCNGFNEYLCWTELYKSFSKESLQDVRLKYFRPNQINHVSCVPYLESREDLMLSLVKNVASYWCPRVLSYIGKLNESMSENQELRPISKHYLESCSVEELRNILINVVSYEELSGHVFQNFLLINKLFEQSKYLTFIKGCFSFYDGFSHDTVDSLWANRSAWKIISNYLMPGSKNYMYIPSNLLEQIKNSSNPPYDDLFDGAIEYALFILVPCLHRYFTNYLNDFEDIAEDSVAQSEPDNVDDNEIIFVQDLQNDDHRPVCEDQSIINEMSDEAKTAAPAQQEKSSALTDNLLSSILRNRSEYERFKAFLGSMAPNTDDHTISNPESNFNPLMDLECYIDVEKFKMAKGKVGARDELASSIKQSFLTKRYFFGPASPAPRNVQINILGGSGHKMPPRPPSPVLLEVQKYVLQRLNNKWIKQYRATEDFQRRHDRGGSALTRRNMNDNSQSFVFVDSKARANAHDMLQLRKTLLDPIKSDPLKRYAKAKNDRLLRDIEFWIEVQKYKDMHHRHSSTSMIRKKIDTIIDCFLDSTVFPKVQVSVPNDIAHKITETRYDLGPYIFRQAQSVVTKVLCNLWTEFNTWCAKYSYQPLPIAFNKLELEAQQKKLVKQMLRQKQKDEEKERAFFNANTRNSTKRRSRATSVASSITTNDTMRPAVEKIEEFVPTLHWKLSDTAVAEIGENEKRKQFLLKDILDKGMFRDDAAFRNYLTEKISPRKITSSQIFYNPVTLRLSKETQSRQSTKNNSLDSSTGSSKSQKSRSNFDRTHLVSIREKASVPRRNLPRRNLTRRTAISLGNRKQLHTAAQRPASTGTASSSGPSIISSTIF